LKTVFGLLLLCGLIIPIITFGCQAKSVETSLPSQVASSSPTQGNQSQMTPTMPIPADPSLQSLIQKAKEDLGQRLSVSATQINLVGFEEVEWSDSSLGCPQPGMDYLQVITPGYRIMLEVDGNPYEYHSNRAAYFIYCEGTNPTVLPKP
jgi:hypothetical protein